MTPIDKSAIRSTRYNWVLVLKKASVTQVKPVFHTFILLAKQLVPEYVSLNVPGSKYNNDI